MDEQQELNLAESVMNNAFAAFEEYAATDKEKKVIFLKEIGKQLELIRTELVPMAMEESHLPEGRLQGELTRTVNQLNMFADLLTEGSWVEASVDNGNPERKPFPKADIRKMLQPVGPVIVFGASNFPFAFSTAGGDTASALASGSSVVIKGHPAHPQTSRTVFEAMKKAVAIAKVPEYTVQHVEGSFALGRALVQHPITTGVGFTGSFSGGRALMNYAAERERPIPVFAEMSSINPVVIYPEYLQENHLKAAEKLAGSITLGAGQFCTNPGTVLLLEGDGLNEFVNELQEKIKSVAPQTMLHEGIHKNYVNAVTEINWHKDAEVLTQEAVETEAKVLPFLAKTNAAVFLEKDYLQEEIFGPSSLLIICKDKTELKAVLKKLYGQLTSTVMATENDMAQHRDILNTQLSIAGRILINDVPTGVEVCGSMVHGGPYPATSDARFTSVGTTAIKRWVRPVCYQDFPQQFLPNELKDANPLQIWRLIDNEWKK